MASNTLTIDLNLRYIAKEMRRMQWAIERAHGHMQAACRTGDVDARRYLLSIQANNLSEYEDHMDTLRTMLIWGFDAANDDHGREPPHAA